MCRSLEKPARDHAGALADEGTDRLVVTGERLIGGLAAGCRWEAAA